MNRSGYRFAIPRRNVQHIVHSSPPAAAAVKFPDYRVCICGTARDISPFFDKVVSNLRKMVSWFHRSSKILIVESDSNDTTLALLRGCRDIQTISCGSLEGMIPLRTHRLAFCRNIYLDFVLTKKSDFDLMIVVDLDDVFAQPISETLFDNCLLRKTAADWNGVFANQSGRYYDIWALRNDEIDFDCIVENRRSEFQRIIPNTGELLPVKSAFGGLGIYRTACLRRGVRYDGIGDKAPEQCEHVSFNCEFSKLFIDTSMVLQADSFIPNKHLL